MTTMSHFQHASDATFVSNDDPAYVPGSKSTLDITQAANEIKKPEPERQSTLGPSSLPSYIPFIYQQAELQQAEPQPGRTLVLCFDGTGDQFNGDNSNILQLVSMLKKDDKTKQMVYYQAGIGIYTPTVFVTPLMVKLSKTLDAMFAWNLDAHTIGGYEFLMQNYRPGDKICIFGFSRGAYTAGSLAAMIHRVGIIPADNHQQVPFAYKMYTTIDDICGAQANAFKQTFSADVDIEFVGVWDAVDAVGLIPKYFPLTASNTSIKTFRHAVSLDEHRSKFNPNLWNRLIDGIDNRLDNVGKLQGLPIIHQDGTDDRDEPTPTVRAQGHVETVLPNRNNKLTDVEEVWFAGCHCDIGGGSVMNGTRHSLARIPLRWMVRECFKAETGIIFDTASFSEIGIDPATLHPDVLKRPPLSDSLLVRARERVIQTPESTSWPQWFKSWFTSGATEQNAATEHNVPAAGPRNGPSQTVPFDSEDDEDLRDALSPKYDPLKLNGLLWWILEFVPVTMRYQKGNNQWVSYTKINMGKGRSIPQQRSRGVKVHRSVKLRMEAAKYQPLAKLFVEPTWI